MEYTPGRSAGLSCPRDNFWAHQPTGGEGFEWCVMCGCRLQAVWVSNDYGKFFVWCEMYVIEEEPVW